MATKIGSLFGDITINTKQLDKDLRRVNRKLKSFGRSASQAGKSMALGFGTPVAIMGGTAVKVFQNFEQEMAKVKAISGATASEFAMLEKNARDLGASTRFTATNVSELQLNFSKLGFTATEIEKVTKATLNLALATGEDLAESARVSAQTLRGFGLEADEMTRVTDTMAMAFSSSALDLTKFDTAMAIVSASAKLTGVSVEETSAMLGTLTNRGIDASSAGTGLRNVFLKSNEAGLSFREALNRIRDSLDPASTAMDLFGIRGATVGVTLAMTQEETAGLTSKLEDSAGKAQEMADIMDDTLQGSLFKLKSAFEGVQLSLAKKLAPAIRDIVDKISAFMQNNQELISQALLMAGKFAMVGVAVGVMLFAIGQGAFLIANLGTAFGFISGIVANFTKLMALATGGTNAFNFAIMKTQLLTFGKALLVVIGALGIVKGIFEGITGNKVNWGDMVINVLAGIATALDVVVGLLTDVVNNISTAVAKLITKTKELINSLVSDDQKSRNDLYDKYGITRAQVGRANARKFDKGQTVDGMTLEEYLQKMAGGEIAVSGKFARTEENKQQGIQGKFDDKKAFFKTLFSGDYTSILSDLGIDTTGMTGGTEQDVSKVLGLDEEKQAELDGYIKKIQNLQNQVGDTKTEFEEFGKSMKDNFAKSLNDVVQDTKVTKEEMAGIVGQLSDGLTNSFQNFFNGTKAGFKDLANSVIKELQRIIIKKMIVNKILGFAQTTLGLDKGSLVDGELASGGMAFAGKTYLVGERGPELFTPKSSGMVTPNNQLGGSAVINFNINAMDSSSFDTHMEQRRSMIVGMVDEAFNSRGKVGIYG